MIFYRRHTSQQPLNHRQDIIDAVENVDPILKKIQSIIEDYLASGSLNEAIPAVQEAKFHNHSNFIRKAMLVSMERQPFERELVSQLIAALRIDIVPEDQYDEAFQIFLNKLPQVINHIMILIH